MGFSSLPGNDDFDASSETLRRRLPAVQPSLVVAYACLVRTSPPRNCAAERLLSCGWNKLDVGSSNGIVRNHNFDDSFVP